MATVLVGVLLLLVYWRCPPSVLVMDGGWRHPGGSQCSCCVMLFIYLFFRPCGVASSVRLHLKPQKGRRVCFYWLPEAKNTALPSACPLANQTGARTERRDVIELEVPRGGSWPLSCQRRAERIPIVTAKIIPQQKMHLLNDKSSRLCAYSALCAANLGTFEAESLLCDWLKALQSLIPPSRLLSQLMWFNAPVWWQQISHSHFEFSK